MERRGYLAKYKCKWIAKFMTTIESRSNIALQLNLIGAKAYESLELNNADIKPKGVWRKFFERRNLNIGHKNYHENND